MAKALSLRNSLLLALLLCLFLVSCSAPRDLAIAQEATRQLMYSDGAVFYDRATSVLKAKMTREEFLAMRKRAAAMPGSCGPVHLGRSLFVSNNRGDFVAVTSRRACNGGDLEESFGWQIVHGMALLDKYEARKLL